MEMLQPSLFVPGCGGGAAENKATLCHLLIRQESHLRAISVGLQLLYVSSTAQILYKTAFEAWGGETVTVLWDPALSC